MAKSEPRVQQEAVPGSVSPIGAQFSFPGDVSGMSDQLEDILRQRRSAKEQGCSIRLMQKWRHYSSWRRCAYCP